MTVSVRTILFLCTGNYYRSRFAEELFNCRARYEGLSWTARSRALALERGTNNVGMISPLALHALKERGVVAQRANRAPQQCTWADLESADRIVALMEAEHRPLMLERFNGWEDRIIYWNAGDIEVAPPSTALRSIEVEIESLIHRLGQISRTRTASSQS